MKILCSSQMGSMTIMGQTMRVVAIAKALQNRGHQVKYLAGEKLSQVIKNHGIEILPLPPMLKVDFPKDPGLMNNQRYREESLGKLKEITRLLMTAEKEAIAREKPDAILGGTPISLFSAKNAGIPCIMTFLQPHGRKTLDYFRRRMTNGDDHQKYLAEVVSFLAPEMPAGGNLADFISNALNAVNLILVEGMPEISGDMELAQSGEWLRQIEAKIVYTGPLLPEMPANLPGQAELKRRHGGNPDQPLVYVTIGGGSGLIGEEFLGDAFEMFRGLPGIHGVVSTGLAVAAEKPASLNPPPNVIVRSFVPGTELVKASDLTVFHGGSSTLMTCIACGRPAVVVPSMAEQEDNGGVLSRSGAGIVLAKKDLTPELLVEAVKRILNDNTFRINAGKLKELGNKYGGAAAAAEKIEELLLNRRLAGAGAYSGSR